MFRIIYLASLYQFHDLMEDLEVINLSTIINIHAIFDHIDQKTKQTFVLIKEECVHFTAKPHLLSFLRQIKDGDK